MGINNDNLENSNEENVKIINQQRIFKFLDTPMLHRYDEVNKIDEEGNTTVFDSHYEVLEKNRMKEQHQKQNIWNIQKGFYAVIIVKLMKATKMTQVMMFLNRCNPIMIVTMIVAYIIQAKTIRKKWNKIIIAKQMIAMQKI